MNSLRPIGTIFTENWSTYQKEPSDGSKTGERLHYRTFEVTAHREGKEVCRIIEESL